MTVDQLFSVQTSQILNSIPEDILLIIFSSLDQGGLNVCLKVCKLWKQIIENHCLKIPEAFGQEEWGRHFGQIEDTPYLPWQIKKILKSRCPFDSTQKLLVEQTHRLAYKPATIDGQPNTDENLGKRITFPKQSSTLPYSSKEDINTSVFKGEWLLMTKNYIPGTFRRDVEYFKTVIKETNDRTGANYQIPNLMDIFTCAFAEYKRSNTYIFNNVTVYCEESNGKTYQVGAFAPDGISIVKSTINHFMGLALVRKFQPIVPIPQQITPIISSPHRKNRFQVARDKTFGLLRSLKMHKFG